MAYTKNNWAVYNPNLTDKEQPDAFLTKSKLDNMEAGIEAAHVLAEQATGVALEIGEVVEGETAAAEIVEGKLNLTLPKGPQGEPGKDGVDGAPGVDGKDGADGYTPVKGTDYFTEEDKEEIVAAVVATRKVTPYFNEEANAVAACGVHINVDAAEEAGKLRVHWFNDDRGNAQELIVPEGVKIVGGGISDDVVEFYPATSITLNSGYVDGIIGGCFGNGIVGHATVVVNGGTFKNGIYGAGMHWKTAHNNKVGHVDLVVNNTDGECMLLYCANSSGVCSVGAVEAVINNGTFGWVTVGGSNGHTGLGELTINGGTIKVVQGCNRGLVENIKITVNGGTINKLFAGGESGDASVNATYKLAELHINGGTFNNVSAGTNGGVEDASKVSGTYREGVVTDEVAAAMNLVKTMTIEDLYKKLVDAGVLVTE